jgi:hypothetical protein
MPSKTFLVKLAKWEILFGEMAIDEMGRHLII